MPKRPQQNAARKGARVGGGRLLSARFLRRNSGSSNSNWETLDSYSYSQSDP